MTNAPSRWGPTWSRWIGRFLARVYWNTDVRGRRHIPKSGPVLVIANHIGLPDGPIVHGVIPRPSHFLIKAAMMKGSLGLVLRPAGQISVDGSGREALSRAMAVLQRGGVVGVFPEGHRGAGHAQETYGGAAWLAVRSGAAIVPTAIVGTRRTGESVSHWPRPRRRMVVAFGEARHLDVPTELTGRKRQEWAASEVDRMLQEQVRHTVAHTDLTMPDGDASPSESEDAHE